jgi:hypothetical protein
MMFKYFFCCLPMAELFYLTLFTMLSEAPNTQSARQTPKYCFLLVGHVGCIHNIPQYTGSPQRSVDSGSSLLLTSSII